MQGSLRSVSAAQLGAAVIRVAVERAGLRDPGAIAEVYMGNVVSAGLGQNIARQAALHGGLPYSVGACTINKVCGASLKSVMLAAQAVRAGDGTLFVAGGVESMSQAPHLVDARLNQLRYGNATLRDSLVIDGLWCAFEDWPMGLAAEFIADEYNVTRELMDRYSLHSHKKAVKAIDDGKFEAEIVPIEVKDPKGHITVIDTDEAPRRDTSLEALALLKPAFREDGRVTAGNAPGLNDAAAALVVAAQEEADALGVEPLARIVGSAQIAVEPKYIFDAPARVIPLLLGNIDWMLTDVDLIELNEAFAAQILANGTALKDQGWDWNRVNVNGGAIALGHPLGATGARILTTLLYALKDRNLHRGIAALCLGGGEAVAVAVERTA
jgi:acetyl-CoA C-acetyltransferase